ncbi:MAG: hypothetical protein LBM06_01725 [Prevotellaceae bacterium]|jgi:hypothetical protein|nr:hypothetical protein [Prevotellaceae bacterium]
MSNNNSLSYKFNMAMGLLPTLLSIVLSHYMTLDFALGFGATSGVLYRSFTFLERDPGMPRPLLVGNTVVLLLLTLVVVLFPSFLSPAYFPFALELFVLIPAVPFFCFRRRMLANFIHLSRRTGNYRFIQSAQSTMVSVRVLLLLVGIHLLVVCGVWLFARPLGESTHTILFQLLPPVVLALVVVFNQVGIGCFNKMVKNTIYIPIVNTDGDVIGRSPAMEIIGRKTRHIAPVVRIALVWDDLIFLSARPEKCTLERGKTDLPIEGYLIYGESLAEGINRLLLCTFPEVKPTGNLQFVCKTHVNNEATNRLNYLFVIRVSDEALFHQHPQQAEAGKLWTFQQIEQNLGKGFFSSCFEGEYEQLKEKIKSCPPNALAQDDSPQAEASTASQQES